MAVSVRLPQPDEPGLEIARRLGERIRRELAASGGWLGFERYMRLALYHPELGYYHNGSRKFGARGDFVTAPELSNFFAAAIARETARVLAPISDPVILEIGAGTGRLAEDLGQALRNRSVDARYWILEPSAQLSALQQARLAAANIEARWLDGLPAEPIHGLVLANEVVDAMPVRCFIKREGVARPLGVAWTRGAFAWAEGEPDEGLADAVAALEARLGWSLPEGFRSEISPERSAWITSVASSLEKGAILIVDYGLSERELYHPQRHDGTLMCHFRHRAHADPFLWPGLQDISAWVDFSACARAAAQAGLTLAGFTTQGQFLVRVGAEEGLGGAAGREAVQALKTLVLPGEMGERFKLLLLARELPLAPPPGRDLRDRL